MSILDLASDKIIDKYSKRKSSFYSYYPMNGLWKEEKGQESYVEAIRDLKKKNPSSAINIYIHFPFCETQCLFCHCFTIISKDRKDHDKIVDAIVREVKIIKKICKDLDYKPNIKEIHFGGGSPSNLSEKNFQKLIEAIQSLNKESKLVECALEIDPRYNINEDKLLFFSDIGINRISFGIQDFDPSIGKTVNRINSYDQIKNLLTDKVRSKFNGINFDFIYGMPKQTLETWEKTIEKATDLSPDRLAVYVWGFRPDLYPHMKTLEKYERADLITQHKMFNYAANKFLKSGYEFIGIDHFAKKTDVLYKAKVDNTLDRNAIGYTSGLARDIVAIGPNSMSTIGDYYFQNHHVMRDYYKKIDQEKLPLVRGYKANPEDILRREIIFDIILKEKVEKKKIKKNFEINNFDEYFKYEIQRLIELEKDGLIKLSDTEIEVTNIGRVFQRHICNVFDQFHHNIGYKYSRDFKDGKEAFNRKTQLGR